VLGARGADASLDGAVHDDLNRGQGASRRFVILGGALEQGSDTVMKRCGGLRCSRLNRWTFHVEQSVSRRASQRHRRKQAPGALLTARLNGSAVLTARAAGSGSKAARLGIL
jgi:hypothetical protein